MREDTMKTQRAMIAHHEAGHAVIAYRPGLFQSLVLLAQGWQECGGARGTL